MGCNRSRGFESHLLRHSTRRGLWRVGRVGRRRSPAKRVYGPKPVSRVRIPCSPPHFCVDGAFHRRKSDRALIAQPDRVFGYEPKGRRFESCWAHHVGAKSALLRRIFYAMTKRCPPSAFLLLLSQSRAPCWVVIGSRPADGFFLKPEISRLTFLSQKKDIA